MVHGIVRGHRGAIRVHSEPGRGTTFRIVFPTTDRPADPVAARQSSEEGWRFAGTVLVVDDEPDVRELTEEMLRRFGLSVLTAQEGREGVETFRKHADEIDVVLLDLTMPGMAGEDVLSEIQRIQSDQRIVLMSGYSEEFAVSRFHGRIAGFLQKPFTREQLGEVLRPALRETG